jgi:5S rRNA maturation endonuclease (ribonuclease M5)
MSKVVERIACPICVAEGKDSEGDNLTMFADGAYACAANKDHTKLVVKARPDLATQNGKLESKRPISNPRAPKKEKLGPVVEKYPYHDQTGKVVYEIWRHEPKTFRPYRIENGKPILGMGSVAPLPYRLHLVIGSDTIIVVEGERDVETLEGLGYVATTNPFGAEKWQAEWSQFFAGKEIILCGDNDAPGRRHMEQVEAALKPVAKSVKRVEIPAPAKDVSAHLEGLSDTEGRAAVEELIASAESTGVRAISICDIACDVRHDPDELLRHRFLCRGGGAMLNGPTGIGKSSFILQAAVQWSLGNPFFAIEPARPLKSLVVQAENDAGDLVEQREGVFTGLDLSDADRDLVRDRVFVRSVNSKTGAALISGEIRPLLREHRPELLWLDNLFAYCGCNVSDQEKMSLFLRNLINPLIQEFQCGLIIAHHTNKPPSGEQKADWSVSETAYMGSGTGELANWPRAILSIRALKTHGVFELVAGKRGSRLGWKDADNKTTCRRNIAHSTDGLIYWREADADEVPAKAGKKQKHFVEDILRLLADKRLGATEWQKLCHQEKGIPSSTFYELKAEAESSKRIAQDDSDKWFKLV